MEIRSGLKRLKAKAQRLHRLYEAMLVISNSLTIAERQALERDKEQISNAKRSDLHRLIPDLEKALVVYRAEFGFKAPNSELIEILERSEATPEGKLLRVTKDWIEDLCSGYNKFAKDFFAKLPAHALIEIDPGRYHTKRGDISWYWLEATVFEDMCALFNLAKEHAGKQSDVENQNKRRYKTGLSLNRSTVIVAFHFVEAYLNGLAFDYWIRNRVGMDQTTTAYFGSRIDHQMGSSQTRCFSSEAATDTYYGYYNNVSKGGKFRGQYIAID